MIRLAFLLLTISTFSLGQGYKMNISFLQGEVLPSAQPFFKVDKFPVSSLAVSYYVLGGAKVFSRLGASIEVPLNSSRTIRTVDYFQTFAGYNSGTINQYSLWSPKAALTYYFLGPRHSSTPFLGLAFTYYSFNPVNGQRKVSDTYSLVEYRDNYHNYGAEVQLGYRFDFLETRHFKRMSVDAKAVGGCYPQMKHQSFVFNAFGNSTSVDLHSNIYYLGFYLSGNYYIW